MPSTAMLNLMADSRLTYKIMPVANTLAYSATAKKKVLMSRRTCGSNRETVELMLGLRLNVDVFRWLLFLAFCGRR
jgi:hypothetical protein